MTILVQLDCSPICQYSYKSSFSRSPSFPFQRQFALPNAVGYASCIYLFTSLNSPHLAAQHCRKYDHQPDGSKMYKLLGTKNMEDLGLLTKMPFACLHANFEKTFFSSSLHPFRPEGQSKMMRWWDKKGKEQENLCALLLNNVIIVVL